MLTDGPLQQKHVWLLVKTAQQKWQFQENDYLFFSGQVKHCELEWILVKAYCTIWGSWMSVRLLIRAWLRWASSFSRLSLCCSIILFSSSIVFRLHSIEEICFRVQNNRDLIKLSGQRSRAFILTNDFCESKYLPGFGAASCLLLFSCWIRSVLLFHDPDVEYHLCFQHLG